MNIDFKKIIPHGIAVLLFLITTLVVFLPLFGGKVISQHDVTQWTGMSKEIVDFRNQYHTEPLWTNSMFGGMPAYQISVLYPANLISVVNSILSFGFPAPASYFIIALLGFYLLLISFKIDLRLAIAGAIAFAFSSYNFVIIIAGHNSKAHAIALIPLVIAGIFLTYQKRFLFGGAVAAIGLALEIYANHLQITYYLFITILILIASLFIGAILNKTLPDFIKSSLVLVVAAVLAIGCNITSLWATYEYGKYSTRGQSELTEKKASSGLDKDYAFSYSYGISETMTLLIPRFHGGASSGELGKNSALAKALQSSGVPQQNVKQILENAPLYWGNMLSTAGPPYAGAIIVYFFVLGFFILKGKEKWWLIIATVVSCFLAWGENFSSFNDFVFFHFPGYDKFRAVSMTLVIAQFTIPLMAILALQRIFDGSLIFAQLKKPLLNSLYIVGGLCLVFSVIPSLAGDFHGSVDDQLQKSGWPVNALLEDRESILRTDAFRSLFFIAVAFGLLWFMLKGKLKKEYGFIVLVVFIMADLWLVGNRYLNSDNYESKSKAEAVFTPSVADQQILADKDPDFRVMNTTVSTFNDATTSYFHKSIGGYHGAKLKRFQELTERQISQNNMNVLNMLNTKYFIMKGEDGQPGARLNPGALGSVWFVKNFKMVANADSEINALTDFNPSEMAIVDKRFEDQLKGFNPGYDSTATIRLTSYLANDLKYESKSAVEQLAVFSEIYYDKGWNAYVDGKLTPHFRVNYVLRAMRIPAGVHKVEFKFEPTVYATGEKISLASSALLILLFAGTIVMEIKKGSSVKK